MKKTDSIIFPFDITLHQGKTFLIGGYRVKKGQLNWILGKKPSRDSLLYNVRFSPIKGACRDGAIAPGVLPDYIVIYDFIDPSKNKLRLFKCLSYSILIEKEMESLKYPNPKGSYIVYLLGDEFDASFLKIDLINNYAHEKYPQISQSTKKKDLTPYLVTGLDIMRAMNPEIPFKEQNDSVTIIDLFAGLGGFHHAFKSLAVEMGFDVKCAFVSELRDDLRHLYSTNYGIDYNKINKDITLLENEKIISDLVPPHDILCAGFPCQPFSKAGKQQGFDDEEGRGVLFNYIADIIKVRRPKYIFLENVSNLETHDSGRTWEIIKNRLTNDEEHGGLNYEIQSKIISPHEYGFPQHRKRIYIVGIDRNVGNLDRFSFPIKPTNATCDITAILENNPTEPQPITNSQLHYIEVWQEFLDLCKQNNAKLPQAPIWAMEFGATYEYNIAPAFQDLTQLCGCKGKLGQLISGQTTEECLSCLPNYAQTSKTQVFPDWKIKFIEENRHFYEQNSDWIDIWKEQIKSWDNSFMKFEWNCDKDGVMSMDDKILQFRPSGLRVKRPTYSPALTFTSSQVPIFPGVYYKNKDGKKIKGRYMTKVEAARIQGMGDLSFEGLTRPRVFAALGNAVDVEVIKMIAKNLLICKN